MPVLTQGILISIEGIDGSGKSTLAQTLYSLFHDKEYPILLTKEPGGTEFGKKIREIVQTQRAYFCPMAGYLLFAADRAQHFNDVVIPGLNAHKLIISDRMADSSIAYQGYGNSLDLHHIDSINQWTMNSIHPHITVFVRMPVDVALKRIAQRSSSVSSFENREFLEKVVHGFETLYKNRKNVIVIDGTLSQEVMAQHSFSFIEQWIQKNKFLLPQ